MNRFIQSVAVAVVILAAGPAAAALSEHNLAETIERFENLRAGSRSAAVKDLRLSSGHLDLVLKTGYVTPVRAGEDTVGLFFQGAGSLEYRSADPIEFPVMSYNVRKDTSLPLERNEKTLVVRDGFERLIWLASGPLPPEVRDGEGPPLEIAWEKQLEKFRRVRRVTVSHDFAVQRLNSPSSPLVMAFLEGGREDLGQRVFRSQLLTTTYERVGRSLQPRTFRLKNVTDELRAFLRSELLGHGHAGQLTAQR